MYRRELVQELEVVADVALVADVYPTEAKLWNVCKSFVSRQRPLMMSNSLPCAAESSLLFAVGMLLMLLMSWDSTFGDRETVYSPRGAPKPWQ